MIQLHLTIGRLALQFDGVSFRCKDTTEQIRQIARLLEYPAELLVIEGSNRKLLDIHEDSIILCVYMGVLPHVYESLDDTIIAPKGCVVFSLSPIQKVYHSSEGAESKIKLGISANADELRISAGPLKIQIKGSTVDLSTEAGSSIFSIDVRDMEIWGM